MESSKLKENIDYIRNNLGTTSPIIVKNFIFGKTKHIEAAIIYINGLASKDIIDRDILNPLMLYVDEVLEVNEGITDYLCKRYIAMSSTLVADNIDEAIDMLKRGKTIILIEESFKFITVDTTAGNYRSISEPVNETGIKGPKEGFIENLETNITMIRRHIKDKSLTIEYFKIGRRAEADVAIIYIADIADSQIVDEIKKRVTAIDVDDCISIGHLEQYIEDYTYNVFPQAYTTERPDIVDAQLLEGKVAILKEGSCFAITLPAIFIEFFQTIEDYSQRTIVSSLIRILRMIAVFIVITLPAIYLTLIKFNSELIPIKFITPIVQSRIGIALTPFLEILAMEAVVEFLREGGLRLPSKIAQTLSVVGGIIIGDTAIKSKVVSPTTLLVIGICVIASFLIPNYDMSLAIRFLRFPMLALADIMGIFGIIVGWFFILVNLCSLDSLGVSYLSFNKADMKDTFIRAPLWKMNKRPEQIPNNNPTRQTDFRKKFRGNKDE